jgi:hypothetical protein
VQILVNGIASREDDAGQKDLVTYLEGADLVLGEREVEPDHNGDSGAGDPRLTRS